jgi:hypothetical protein
MSAVEGQARMPKSRIEHTIGGMRVGEIGYTVPWAVAADGDGLLWIDEGFTIHPHSGGTLSMLVERRPGGYVVDVSDGFAADYRWPATERGTGGAPVLGMKGA